MSYRWAANENAIEVDWALAERVVNSAAVLSVYAACEWDELDNDGKAWIAAIVAQAARKAPQ